jgi:hypothetical protein
MSGTKQTAGKDLVTGIGKGVAYTAAAGVKTASSAFVAGKYFVNGEKDMARRNLITQKIVPSTWGKPWPLVCWRLVRSRMT